MSQTANSVFVIYKKDISEVDQISNDLNLNPDKISLGNNQGHNSVWKMFCKNKDHDLEEQLEHWVNLLKDKASVLQKFKTEGWVIEIDCLVQPDDGAALLYFEPRLLKSISCLNISLKVRFWD